MPLRIVLMLLFMPFRALSGYMVGQNANAFVVVGGSFLVLRRWWRNTPGIEPYWRENKSAILRYLVPVLALTVASFDPCRLSVVVWYLCATQLAIGSMLVVSAIRRRMLYSDF